MFQKINHGNLNEIVFTKIKEKIIDNDLKPGEKLDIDQLSAQLGVSRTPVTNALKALEHSGYVVVYPRSGTYVRKYSCEEIEAIFDFRQALEALIVRKAIAKVAQDELRQYETAFRKLLPQLSGENNTDKNDWVENFFAVEVQFHEFLIDACPKIIGQELQNLIDLTKRVRKLHLKYFSAQGSSHDFQQKEILLHIELIHALLSADAEKAETIVRQDIEDTKNEIMSFYPILEDISNRTP